MILYPDCDYFNEERNDEYAPPYGECEECYRYDICKKAKIQELRAEIENGWIKSDKEIWDEYRGGDPNIENTDNWLDIN